jgi:hypothetical protein
MERSSVDKEMELGVRRHTTVCHEGQIGDWRLMEGRSVCGLPLSTICILINAPQKFYTVINSIPSTGTPPFPHFVLLLRSRATFLLMSEIDMATEY